MTLYILFDELKLKNININDRIYFSKHATYQQPSKLGIEENDFITVDELIDSLIIKSANDAAVAIAEKISGTEKKFILKMNDYAKKLHLENTNFANPHGLPNKANLSTAYDIFKLSSKIITDFPEHLHRFKRTEVKIKGKIYTTHNTLLKKYEYYIGLKTGYTRKSGFQVSLLSINGDEYLLGIYFGGNSAKERNNKINYLMNKYRNKGGSKNKETKKLTVKNEEKRPSNYIIQTSSFKKISKSKMHITLLKNKIKILRSLSIK
jgi:D-alanyl-D-alanine carboxypeptidase